MTGFATGKKDAGQSSRQSASQSSDQSAGQSGGQGRPLQLRPALQFRRALQSRPTSGATSGAASRIQPLLADLRRRLWLRGLVGLLFVFAMLVSDPAAARYASLVIDAESGQQIHARNADTRNFPASLTKIMTLYMIFDAVDSGKWTMKTPLKVSRRAAGQPATRLGLRAGKTITVRTAIKALAVRSANDVATVVAENHAGSESRFAQRMTKMAHKLGMKRTQFRNASGLPNRGQLSTARDMARLAIAVRRDFPHYYAFFSTETFTYGGRTYRNHNKLLGRYKGTDGVKTGFTNASGYNLVASVERRGRRLIGVVFGGKTGARRDNHMISLIDKSFAKATRIARTPPRPTMRPGQDSPRATLQLASLNPAPKQTQAPAQTKAQTTAQTLKKAAKQVAAQIAQSAPKPTPKPAAKQRKTAQAIPVPRPPGVLTRAEAHTQQAASTNSPSWSVQIGAYATASPARAILKTARNHLGARFELAGNRVQEVHKSGGVIYRALITGLQKGQARRACAALAARDLPCVLKRPKGTRLAEAPASGN